MKEYPIIFNEPMINAIIDGQKTQTRRVVKPQPIPNGKDCYYWPDKKNKVHVGCNRGGLEDILLNKVSPLTAGDVFWVRETWARTNVMQAPGLGKIVVYKAADSRTDYGGPWKPSIHMPKSACRIRLNVTDVRIERLQEICEEDAIAEGVVPWLGKRAIFSRGDGRFVFHQLWDSIAKPGTRWADNPWVWVYDFEVQRPIGD